jgi:hypothetical protein
MLNIVSPPKGLNGIIATFGDVRDYIKDDGTISQDEEELFLGYYYPTFDLHYAFADVKIKRIRCHKLMVPVFTNVFDDLIRMKRTGKIKEYGGCYCFRQKRIGKALSTHSWGIAIDLNPNTNRLGMIGDIDMGVVKVFKDHGFVWGGDFELHDPMHFQYCSGY